MSHAANRFLFLPIAVVLPLALVAVVLPLALVACGESAATDPRTEAPLVRAAIFFASSSVA